MAQYITMVDEELHRAMPATTGRQQTTAKAMAYAVEDGGKRLRPVLLLEWARLCGADVQTALPFAAAVEMIHASSLVHDDLPCMDNSLIRRGKPSTFAAYGEDMGLLAGDALILLAFEWMLTAGAQGVSAQTAVEAAAALAQAAGIEGMVGGQTIDLESEGRMIDLETLQDLQNGKTAAMIAAACKMGAIVADADLQTRNAAHRFGTELGLCFQIVDDLLDVTSTSEALGKPVGADEENQKATYVTLLGLESAEALAKERTEAALRSLGLFGEDADDLRQLTTALLTRTH
ncbi:MAG: polyprenyl synthetase family protein [Clostridia bacterium]|nr:polyprenyl synthetase family protein [Clostridia bacterium]